MQVQEIMTANPACCTPDASLQEVARLMAEHDCGEIPVIQNRKPVGVVTDRDIAIRAVAKGQNPLQLTARDCMTSPVVTVKPTTDVDECCHTMEEHQIRRVPVVDDSGICGIVSQADIATHASARETAEVVKEISQPNNGPHR